MTSIEVVLKRMYDNREKCIKRNAEIVIDIIRKNPRISCVAVTNRNCPGARCDGAFSLYCECIVRDHKLARLEIYTSTSDEPVVGCVIVTCAITRMNLRFDTYKEYTASGIYNILIIGEVLYALRLIDVKSKITQCLAQLLIEEIRSK